MRNRDFHLIQADLRTALAPETVARFHPEVYEEVCRMFNATPEQYLHRNSGASRSFLFMVEKRDTHQVVAFRCFFFIDNKCMLYCIFVAPDYRQQGIAGALIASSIHYAAAQGFTRFEVPMAGRSPERSGLFSHYGKLMYKLPKTLKFQVTYQKDPNGILEPHDMEGRL